MLQCVKDVKSDEQSCLKSCEGFYVTSYAKDLLSVESFKSFWSRVEVDYDKFKGKQKFAVPYILEGKNKKGLQSP